MRIADRREAGAALDELLRDAATDDPASLPLLEFALDQLYNLRTESGVLTHAAYAKLGGVEGALATRADEVFGTLPERVPIHFALDGKPTTFAPRPMIWLLVLMQAFSLALFASTQFANERNDGLIAIGIGIFQICVLAALAQAQFAIIGTAKTVEQRLPVGRFLITLSALIAIGLVSMRFF